MILRMNVFGKMGALLGIILAVSLMNISVSYSQEATASGVTNPTAQKKGGEKTVAKKNSAIDLYAAEPEPLTVVQCGQCHTGVYRNLKLDGGRHKFACQDCHNSFHSYNPVKNNWQELMPKCSNCHTPPHGEKITECISCHTNPHAAKIIPTSKLLVSSCPECHSNPFEELKKFPSKHSKLVCMDCHTKHGSIPNCSACHKPHFEGQEIKTCTSECHLPHKPLAIIFKKDTNVLTCNACHKNVYSKWSNTPSKHGKVSCTACHTKHGYIPACADCHQATHSKELLARYPKCLTCHLDVHDLPVKQRTK